MMLTLEYTDNKGNLVRYKKNVPRSLVSNFIAEMDMAELEMNMQNEDSEDEG